MRVNVDKKSCSDRYQLLNGIETKQQTSAGTHSKCDVRLVNHDRIPASEAFGDSHNV